MQLGSGVAVATARPAAEAPIRALVRELPCATGAAIKKKKNLGSISTSRLSRINGKVT